MDGKDICKEIEIKNLNVRNKNINEQDKICNAVYQQQSQPNRRKNIKDGEQG